ncbi:iron hydrogenase [Gonapodya prolifera JEL478]|uniref:Iron hydrogenase n=1 Tax=Gonapodya prolifera (strain JEL478) TaxID=1344416 RepID=A0A139ACG9_GONPJ|nr:iron hydrogenase [Gonapodya prolifera JEL478]|eukprot:KXS14501.1 iron hydrogenase [Gonapodya prolifera JEL478]
MSFSAGLQLTDLNDYIAPSQACVKPPEPKVAKDPKTDVKTPIKIELDDATGSYYEVEMDGKGAKKELETAQITLNDCLACSGCITSAESVLVAMQSHKELYEVLRNNHAAIESNQPHLHRTIIVSVAPQSRASIAAKYGLSTASVQGRLRWLFRELGCHVVLDTTFAREVSLRSTVGEVLQKWRAGVRGDQGNLGPALAGACPGWICYAEKTHPHLIRHLLASKSPQQIMGSLAKYYLASKLPPSTPPSSHPLPNQVYHLSIMPCYDKKLEGSRPDFFSSEYDTRDVDCVLTTAEVEKLWREVGSSDHEARGVWEQVSAESRVRMVQGPSLFPVVAENTVEAACGVRWRTAGGTSGGYLTHVVKGFLAEVCGVVCGWNEVDQVGAGGGGNSKEWMVPATSVDPWVAGKLRTGASGNGSVSQQPNGMDVDAPTSSSNRVATEPFVVRLSTVPSRNHDHLDWVISARQVSSARFTTLLKFASSYGFRNIQNLVRKVPAPGALGAVSARMRAKARVVAKKRAAVNGAGDADSAIEDEDVGYSFVEVMACPSGCINGGGQLRPDPSADGTPAPVNAREWIRHSEAKYREEYIAMPELDLWENQTITSLVTDWLGSMETDNARKCLLTEYHPVEKVEVNALTVKW